MDPNATTTTTTTNSSTKEDDKDVVIDGNNPVIDDDESSLMEQKRKWLIEQRLVASMVHIHDDNYDELRMLPEDNDNNSSSSQRPFHILLDNPLNDNEKDDNTTISSFLYGGVDVSFPPPSTDPDKEEEPQSVAVYVIVDSRTMTVVYRDYEYFDLTVPYIPTFLAFREIDPIERLVKKQQSIQPELTPSAILVDGNGVLHPRLAGIACFVGTRLSIPTIGIGKSLLYEGGWTRESLLSHLHTFLEKVHSSCIDNVDGTPTELAETIMKTNQRGLILQKLDDNEKTNNNTDQELNEAPPPDDNNASPPGATNAKSELKERRRQMIHDLAPYCNGIAIPLTNNEHDNDDTNTDRNDHSRRSMTNDQSREEEIIVSHDGTILPRVTTTLNVLGLAMIGHGGQPSIPPPTEVEHKNNNNQNNKKKNQKQSKSKKQSSVKGPGTVQELFVSVGHDISLLQAYKITASLCISKIPEPIRQADLYGRELMRQQQ